jgi:hypothetical protein
VYIGGGNVLNSSPSSPGGSLFLYIFVPVTIIATIALGVCAVVWWKKRKSPAPGFSELDLEEEDTSLAMESTDDELQK